MADVDNTQAFIDSRDVIDRIHDLELELELDDGELDDFDRQELKDELALLRNLEAQAEFSPDWKYGETLIKNSYFTEYAEQLAEDVGAISRGAGWPLNRIDWDAAADDLKVDYNCVDFNGVDYWIRA